MTESTASLSVGWRTLGWIVLVLCLLALALGGYFAYASYDVINDPGHQADPLDGLGYMLGILVAVPAVLSLVLTGAGLVSVRRSRKVAQVLLVFGSVPVGVLTLFLALMIIPTLVPW